MRLTRFLILGAGLCGLLARPDAVDAEATNAAPDFKEVYDLVRAHLAGATDADLNKAAVEGLLSELHSKVSLGSSPTGPNVATTAPLLAQVVLYDGSVGYLRAGRVAEGLAGKLGAACKELGTNQLKGLILDLRFAGGHDYGAAVAAADQFLGKEVPLLDWGNGVVRSKAKTDAIRLPMAVLVNEETAGAAEALAAMLRESDEAVILGANTAGEATIDQEFPLKSGQQLRVATAAVRLGGGETLSAKGVTPDIIVKVAPEDEKAYYADEFKEIDRTAGLASGAGTAESGAAGDSTTNRPPRSARPTEADLIKERKERPGMELEYNVSATTEPETGKPVVRDPALARALDLVKGIAALRPARSP